MSAHTSILRVSAAGAAGAALLAALQPTSVRAQSPGTDVYVVPLLEGASGAGEPRNLTRRAGYDNQPAFRTNGALVLNTSIREDQQADIWRVARPGAEPERLTSTPESEYSPTIVPGTGALAADRVEADSTQRLWSFPASDVPA